MMNKVNNAAVSESILMKLLFKQKKFIYEIARLEFRIFSALARLERVNLLIEEEEENRASINVAMAVTGEGKVWDKLNVWKIKTEYKLFKLNLRKSKIDVVKLVINQAKLEQTRQALLSIEISIQQFYPKQPISELPQKLIIDIEPVRSIVEAPVWKKMPQQNDFLLNSIDKYVREILKMAS